MLQSLLKKSHTNLYGLIRNKKVMYFGEVIRKNHQESLLVILSPIVIFICFGFLANSFYFDVKSVSDTLIRIVSFQIFPSYSVVVFCVLSIIVFFAIAKFFITLNKNPYKKINPLKKPFSKNFTKKSNLNLISVCANKQNKKNLLVTSANNLNDSKSQVRMTYKPKCIKHSNANLMLYAGFLGNILYLTLKYFICFTSNRGTARNTYSTGEILCVLTTFLPIFSTLLQEDLNYNRFYISNNGGAIF